MTWEHLDQAHALQTESSMPQRAVFFSSRLQQSRGDLPPGAGFAPHPAPAPWCWPARQNLQNWHSGLKLPLSFALGPALVGAVCLPLLWCLKAPVLSCPPPNGGHGQLHMGFVSLSAKPRTQARQTAFRVLVRIWISELERSKFKRDESHPALANLGF